MYYVYEWFNTETDEVFYVGKGKGNRYKNVKQRSDYFKNYHSKYNCDVRIIKNKLTEENAFELEIEKINHYRNINQAQCNFADGGEKFGVRKSDIGKSRSRFFGLVSAYNNAHDCHNYEEHCMMDNSYYTKRKYSMNNDNLILFSRSCEEHGVSIGDNNISNECVMDILDEYNFGVESRKMLNVLAYDKYGRIQQDWEHVFED